MDIIEQEFQGSSIIRGGMILYESDIAIRVIQRCKERGYRILGIDSFLLCNDTIQPFMEHSIDCSDILTNRQDVGHWHDAIEFVKEKSRLELGFVYEVVYDITGHVR